MSFTHLQVQSGFSLMDSTITIEKLIKRAKDLQFKSMALTDHQTLYGVIPFYKACKENGIKPIIGMTVNVKHQNDMFAKCVLLAKNNQGYHQLIKLSTLINTENRLTIDMEELSYHTEGLLCILPAYRSHLGELFKTTSFEVIKHEIEQWEAIFTKNDIYIGIQDHGLSEERELHQSVKAFNEIHHIPVVAINDVHYLKEGDTQAFDCLQAMKKGQKWDGEKPVTVNKQLHLRSSVEMEQLFGAFWPDVLEETNRIAHKCHVTINLERRMLPSYPVPENVSAHAYLKELCKEKIQTRYSDVTPLALDRLNYELDIIQSMHFSDYFLIVWDFINFAKSKDIMVGPGRGSSAGSIVAYVLGITEVDPLKYDLLFERFLNPERVSMPDIDVDISDHRRDEVIDYVKNKYGKDHVAQIITFGTFAARSLIRELSKTMGINQLDVSYILQFIPVQSGQTLRELVNKSRELKQYIKQSEQLKQLFSIAIKLEGLPRHISTHAAGVVVSDKPLTQHVPLKTGTSDLFLTQYPMDALEAVGLLKMDFLGLRNLTLLERITRSIQHSENKTVPLSKLHPNDAATFQLLQKAKTNGIFQLESSGMKQVLKRLKPTNFEDIVAVNALYRPGPMDFITTYINRKHGHEEVIFPHPNLEHILDKTYGVLIYQEQIMQIAHEIAGFTLGQADILRRAVSKKQHHLMEEQKEAFIKGSLDNGYDKLVGEELFAWIVKFSNYGFPKSHAVAYSKISYQLAYLKAHFPKYFYAELLSSVANQHDKTHVYINEMKELDISILPPSINKSFGKYTVEPQGIRMGMLSIKGVGHQVIKEIIHVRKEGSFKDLFDFCLRISFQMINRGTLEQLILAGTFDDLYDNRASLLATIDMAMEQGSLFREFSDMGRLIQEDLKLENTYVKVDDFSNMKKLADEKDLVGLYLSPHPLVEYRNQLRSNGYLSLTQASHLVGKRHINCAAVIQSIKVIRTKRGDPMAFLMLSDEEKEMESVVFPDLYRKTKKWIEENQLIYLRGNVESRKGQIQFLLNDIRLFDPDQLKQISKYRLFIKLVDHESDDARIVIKKLAQRFPGTTPIIIYHQKLNRTYQLSSTFYIHPTYECLQAFNDFFKKENVVLEKQMT